MRRFLPALLLILASCGVYANSLLNTFALDDLPHIVQNGMLTSWPDALTAFCRPIHPGNLYRPLLYLNYAVLHHFFGLTPLAFHLESVLLHTACTLLLWWLLPGFISPRAAFWSALLFATAPIHVEAVANVSGQAELLSHAAGLVALVLTVRLAAGRSRNRLLELAAAGACLAGALLTKESALVYLLLAPLALYYHPGADRIRARAPLLLFLAISLLYFGLRALALDSLVSPIEISVVDNPLAALPLWQRVIKAFALLGAYAALTVAPLKFSADYSFAETLPVLEWHTPLFAARLLLFAALAIVAAAGLRRRSVFGLFGCWFFFSFAVTSNVLFPIGTVMGERLAYLPSLGMLGLVVSATERFASRKALAVLGATVCLLYSLRTWRQNYVWFDNETLHAYQLTASPRSVRTLTNAAVLLRNKGQYAEARTALRQVLALAPEYPEAQYAMATISLFEGRLNEAEEELKRTLRLAPGHLQALESLGRLYLAQNRLPAAERFFKLILHLAPESYQGKKGLLAVAIASDNLPQAQRIEQELMITHGADPELRRLGSELKRRLESSKQELE